MDGGRQEQVIAPVSQREKANLRILPVPLGRQSRHFPHHPETCGQEVGTR